MKPFCFHITRGLLTGFLCLGAVGCATTPTVTPVPGTCLSAEMLAHKKALRLKEIAADVREQRRSTADFGGFLTRMSANLAGYNRYIQAGSFAAAFAKVFPVPYAGQVGVFTKFAAESTININNASRAIIRFDTSSQTFLHLVDAINPEQPDSARMDEASRFADRELLQDMTHLKQKLTSVSDLSAGALSFLEGLQQHLATTDEYWNKTKGLFKKEVDPKEKGFLSENIGSLKQQTGAFNQRLQRYHELTLRQGNLIKSLTLYDELAAELQPSKVD